jgi:hypothetical protein
MLSPEEEEFLGLLQQVVRSGNDWTPSLRKVLAGATEASVRECVDAYGRIRPHVDHYLQRANALIEATPSLRRWWGDVLTGVLDQWECIVARCAGLDAAHPELAVPISTDCAAGLTELTFQACRITIPPRLKDELANLAVGESINFDEWYADEVTDEPSRTKILKELSDQTLLVDGYVSLDDRTITRVSPSLVMQWLSVIIATLVAAACAGVLYGLQHWGSAPGLKAATSARPSSTVVVVDAGLVWFGMIAHVSLSWYKGFRRQGPSVPRSARRILYLLSSRQLAIWVAIVVGAVLTYAFASTGRVTEAAAVFAVGYSADSLIDTLAPRFDAQLAKLASALPGPTP